MKNLRTLFRVLPLAAMLIVSSAHAQPAGAAADRIAIEHVLQTSAADWSRGDLPAFMHSYENGPQTTYIGRRGMVTGYDAIQSRYAASFPAGRGHSMGKLSLDILESRPLDPAYVLVTGRFTLVRPQGDGGGVTGIFSLLMHHGPSGWRITYDHSS